MCREGVCLEEGAGEEQVRVDAQLGEQTEGCKIRWVQKVRGSWSYAGAWVKGESLKLIQYHTSPLYSCLPHSDECTPHPPTLQGVHPPPPPAAFPETAPTLTQSIYPHCILSSHHPPSNCSILFLLPSTHTTLFPIAPSSSSTYPPAYTHHLHLPKEHTHHNLLLHTSNSISQELWLSFDQALSDLQR